MTIKNKPEIINVTKPPSGNFFILAIKNEISIKANNKKITRIIYLLKRKR